MLTGNGNGADVSINERNIKITLKSEEGQS